MHSQLYLTGRVASAPELFQTKKGKLWVKLLLETELVRSDGRGSFQAETVVLPVSFFSREAEAVKDLLKGDALTVGAHLYGTEFQTDGGELKRGIQVIADAIFLPSPKGGVTW